VRRRKSFWARNNFRNDRIELHSLSRDVVGRDDNVRLLIKEFFTRNKSTIASLSVLLMLAPMAGCYAARRYAQSDLAGCVHDTFLNGAAT
jgi:hypothetical protein